MKEKEETKSKFVPITKEMVYESYKKVRENGGSAGVDNVSIKDFEEELDGNLYKIWNRLASGSYFPPPVKEVEIPKKDRRMRKLGIPTVSDRIAQMVIKIYLEPEIDKVFHQNSYGYRPGKSAHQALEQVRKNCQEYWWVIDLDIQGFFDNIDHKLLMLAVEKHTQEMWVKMYIQRWLEMPIKKASGELIYREGKGTPQGGVISPLLANLFLHYVFDKWIEQELNPIKFARYADDIIVHCKTKKQAEYFLERITKRIAECKLKLHPEKTKIVFCKGYGRKMDYKNVKFNFLGYSFQPRVTKTKEGKRYINFDLAISREAKNKIVEELRNTKFHRMSTSTIEDIAKLLNPKLRGWINYYGKYRIYEMAYVFRRLSERLMRWLLNRYKQLKKSVKKAYSWLKNICKNKPTLFAHWSLGFKEY
jgi:group II intron reverse transcriptase/maturase